MADKIYLNIEIDDKGTMKRVAVDAKKLSSALGVQAKTGQAADRAMKGLSQQSSNSTKNFSKMAQSLQSGIVPVYATLAANVFALTAAFQFLKNAADLRVLQDSQTAYAEKTGLSLKFLTNQVQEATNGILQFQDAASGVAIGNAAGLDGQQLVQIADLAKRASLALGRDLTDSYNRLIRGITKGEPELLDELGIILRLEDATKKYAKALNISAKDLTAYQRTQAVANDVLEQGAQKFDDLAGSVNQINKLGKAFSDLVNDIKKTLTPLTEFVAGTFSESVGALTVAFGALSLGIIRSMAPGIGAIEDLSAAAEGVQGRLADAVRPTSRLGKALADVEMPLTDANLRDLDRAINSTKSKVVDFGKVSRTEARRLYHFLDAERHFNNAEWEKGFKRRKSLMKANYAVLIAQNGRLGAALKSVGRIAATALNWAGYLGAMYVAIQLLTDFMERFKDPEIKKFQDNMSELLNILDEQNANIAESKFYWADSAREAEKVIFLANKLSTLSFENLQDIQLPRGQIIQDPDPLGVSTAGAINGPNEVATIDRFADAKFQASYKAAADLFERTTKSLEFQILLLDEAGQNTDNLSALQDKLAKSWTALSQAASLADQATINAAMTEFQAVLGSINQISKESTAVLRDQASALQSLAGLTSDYDVAVGKVKNHTSQWDALLGVYQRTRDALQGIVDANNEVISVLTVGDLSKEQQQIIVKTLGYLNEELTLEQAIVEVKKRINSTILEEERVMLAGLKLQRDKIKQGTKCILNVA